MIYNQNKKKLVEVNSLSGYNTFKYCDYCRFEDYKRL